MTSAFGIRATLALVALAPGTCLNIHPGRPDKINLRRCLDTYSAQLDSVRDHLGDATRSHRLEPVATSSRNIILGAGSGTTGTRSIGTALGLLGLSGWHFPHRTRWGDSLFEILGRFVPPFTAEQKTACRATLQAHDYTRIPPQVDYILDAPIAELFIDLYLAFPNAKFILSTRPELEWAERRLQHPGSLPPLQEPCGEHITRKNWTVAELASLEKFKNELVECVVPKSRLLKFSLFTDPPSMMKSLMRKMSRFSGHPIKADQQFPNSFSAVREDDPSQGCQASSKGKLPRRLGSRIEHEGLLGNLSDSDIGESMARLARSGCELSM